MSALGVPLLQEAEEQRVFQYGPKSLEPLPANLPIPNPTKSFWIDTPGANPLAKEGSEGPLSRDADVCIIGSGITGVSAAYHLSKRVEQVLGGVTVGENRRQLKAVILEAREFCSGATGRNGGHLKPFVFRGFHTRKLVWGSAETIKGFELENYTSEQLVKILREEGLEDKVDFVDGGHITLHVTEEEEKVIRQDFQAAKEAGVNLDQVKWISKEEMEETYGASYPGVQMPGHNVWPLKLVTEMYRLAKDKNPSAFALNLHTNTPVTAVVPGGEDDNSRRRWSVETARGSVACSYVIHATNGYASHLLPHLAGPAGIVPTRGQVIALQANATLSQLSKSAWTGNQGFEYWFPRPVPPVAPGEQEKKPLVILGGGRECSGPGFEIHETDDSRLNPLVGQGLRNFLPALFPGKFEVGREPEMEWTGIMGFTKSGDPFVGPVRAVAPGEVDAFKGQYISAGYSGHGMPRAFACAEAVAGMVVADITGQMWQPPEWLPNHYLAWPRH